MTVAASLWSVPQESLEVEASRMVDAGVTRFHWDFADGSMSRPGGFKAGLARSLARAGSVSDAHLMQRDPRASIMTWTGWCASIAVHANQPFWRESLELVAGTNSFPVLAVMDEAELSSAQPEWGVLIMSIVPGEAGGRFEERSYELVAAAASRGHRHIGVDGSITPERSRRLLSLGATTIVSGSSLTGSSDPRAWVRAATARYEGDHSDGINPVS